MKTIKSEIPSGSLANRYLADYSDCFYLEVDPDCKVIPGELLVSFFTDQPFWVRNLFRLRDFAVCLVGLKSSKGRNIGKLEQCIKEGVPYGFMERVAANDRETVLMLKDSHLVAYISVNVEPGEHSQKVNLITVVKFKRTLGRIYFFLISPLHGMVVRRMLERCCGKLGR